MDRFTVSGSKRPALILDEAICLRLPSYQPIGSTALIDSNFFSNGSSLPYAAGLTSGAQSSGAILVEIVRILGTANRYLASGGVKGDTHFPWHSNSTLTRIRSDLEFWAASTPEAFTSYDAVFGHPEVTPLVLSKLVYHLIYCLIYRPFLPLDLAELTGVGQHQSWQIEATNICFLHANAIADTVDVGKSFGFAVWPAFVGYCLCTAGTIHVHGAHYVSFQEGDMYSNSAENLTKEMSHLSDLRYMWACVQHQHETLQAVFRSHSLLVQSLASSPMRFSPVFQMEDFFDRYPGTHFDGAHIPFADIPVDLSQDIGSMFSDIEWSAPAQPSYTGPAAPMLPSQDLGDRRSAKRRKMDMDSSFSYPAAPIDLGVQLAQQTSTYQEQHNHIAHDQSNLHPPPTFRPPSATSPPDQNNVGMQYLLPDHFQNQTLSQSALSPNFTFSPIPFNSAHVTSYPTPGGISVSNESNHTDPDKDPFLSLLEQLAQNDGNGGQGPSDLDFFLSGQG